MSKNKITMFIMTVIMEYDEIRVIEGSPSQIVFEDDSDSDSDSDDD